MSMPPFLDHQYSFWVFSAKFSFLRPHHPHAFCQCLSLMSESGFLWASETNYLATIWYRFSQPQEQIWAMNKKLHGFSNLIQANLPSILSFSNPLHQGRFGCHQQWDQQEGSELQWREAERRRWTWCMWLLEKEPFHFQRRSIHIQILQTSLSVFSEMNPRGWQKQSPIMYHYFWSASYIKQITW